MFESALLESGHRAGRRRGWETLAAAAMQAAALGAVWALPLFEQARLPEFQALAAPALVVPEQPPPAREHSAAASGMESYAPNLLRPGAMTRPIISPRASTAPMLNFEACSANCLLTTLSGLSAEPGPRLLGPMNPPLHTSRLDRGEVLRRVQPVYPPMARAARIQGDVVLRATISRAGELEDLQVLSGSPLLAQAAVEAVRQWKFRPYILNGTAVAVETQITVSFRLE